MPVRKTVFGSGWMTFLFSMSVIYYIIILFWSRCLPFIDLPLHLSMSTIIRAMRDNDAVYPLYYSTISLFKIPNTFHIGFCSLPLFPDIEFANLIYYIVYIILFPLAILHLIREMKGNPVFVFLSFIFIFNYNAMWGFVGFMSGVPLVIIYISILYRSHITSEWKYNLFLSLFLMLLFYFHLLISFFCICITIGTAFIFRKNVRDLLVRISVSIPSFMMAGYWWFHHGLHGRGGNTFWQIVDYYRTNFFQFLVQKAGLIYWNHYLLWKGAGGIALGILFSVFIMSLFLMIRRNEKWKRIFIQNFAVRYILFFIFVAIVFSVFFPRTSSFRFSFYRFSVFIWLGVIVLLSLVASGRQPRRVIAIMFFLSILNAGLYGHYFYQFQKENRSFDPSLFSDLDRNGIMTAVIYDGWFRFCPIYYHFPSYYIIWNRGIFAPRRLDIQTATYPVKANETLKRFPIYKEILQHDSIQEFDYVLVRGRIPEEERTQFTRFRLFREREEWKIFIKIPENNSFMEEEPCTEKDQMQ